MDDRSINEIDVAKLNTEILQLRNQQFYLGTVALAGSGLTSWIAPAVSAVTDQKIPEIALVGASIIWLILLALLFAWSIALRNLIAIISQYIEAVSWSKWEVNFRRISKESELIPSQSFFVSLAVLAQT